MREIIWTKYFDNDVRNIVVYILEFFGKDYANNFLTDVKMLMRMLSEFPEVGRHDEKDLKIFKYSLKRKSIIYFTYNEKRIEFIGLKNAKQNLENIKFKK